MCLCCSLSGIPPKCIYIALGASANTTTDTAAECWKSWWTMTKTFGGEPTVAPGQSLMRHMLTGAARWRCHHSIWNAHPPRLIGKSWPSKERTSSRQVSNISPPIFNSRSDLLMASPYQTPSMDQHPRYWAKCGEKGTEHFLCVATRKQHQIAMRFTMLEHLQRQQSSCQQAPKGLCCWCHCSTKRRPESICCYRSHDIATGSLSSSLTSMAMEETRATTTWHHHHHHQQQQEEQRQQQEGSYTAKNKTRDSRKPFWETLQATCCMLRFCRRGPASTIRRRRRSWRWDASCIDTPPSAPHGRLFMWPFTSPTAKSNINRFATLKFNLQVILCCAVLCGRELKVRWLCVACIV